MYYVWKNYINNEVDFFTCGLERLEDYREVNWFAGERIEQSLPTILRYNIDSMILPADYPMTAGGGMVLISGKIMEIFDRLNITGFDRYPSEIIRPNGEIIGNYYTLNLLNKVSCVNQEQSMTQMKKLGPVHIPKYKKLVLDYDKIPSDVLLFRLEGRETIILVYEKIKKAFDEEGVTGADLIDPRIERPNWAKAF